MSLHGQKVLVTGATGFIGGRLAERLALDYGATVTGCGRNLSQADHLRPAGVTLHQADLADADALRPLLAGQAFVFHLAAAMGASDEATSQRVNVTAAVELARLAAASGVRRLVHVSSIAAYGPPDRPLMDEDHPLDRCQPSPYGRTKAEGEWQARQAAERLGLEFVAARPGMVYGPRGRSWTVAMLRLVQRRLPSILGDGRGHAHPIYVDNLVDGLALAATRPQAAGQAFNFVDRPLPWRDFLGYYGRMAGRRPVRLPLWLARAGLVAYKLISGRRESAGSLLRYYTAQAVYPTARAGQVLGYRPRVGLEEGMRRTEAWLQQAGYLPAA